MRLGIDFGTSRIVIAAADRGNYPLIAFELPDGSSADWYPSLVALRGAERCYGWDAWDMQADPSWTVVRSIKRLLEEAGPHTVLDLGGEKIPLMDLLSGLTRALLTSLHEKSTLPLSPGEKLQAIIGIPANANTNQRFLTVEAFCAAGFQILGLLSEPSAASIEFGHRQTKARGETILVYDLGGGTFDASLVKLDENVHHVIASEGISTIGGDDFDQILADLALESAGIDSTQQDGISAGGWFRLLDECRSKKEAIHPNTRRLSIDLETVEPEWAPVTVQVAHFYETARPLVEETLGAVEELLTQAGPAPLEALYMTGGGSELPLVARVLRERFGRRVRRSAYTRSATAIGLAIQAERPEFHRLSERLTRYFGVWREAESGSRIVFDPLFEKGLSLPASGEPPLTRSRIYSPVHNIGYFRYLECSHRTADGTPSGDITLWDEIQFAFDPALKETADLHTVSVDRWGYSSEQAEEVYECDSDGSISVTIVNLSSHYSKKFPLGRWSQQETAVKPGKRKTKARSTAR